MGDPSAHIGKSIEIWNHDESDWFDGVIDDFQPSKGWHIQLYNGDDTWRMSLDQDVKFDDVQTVNLPAIESVPLNPMKHLDMETFEMPANEFAIIPTNILGDFDVGDPAPSSIALKGQVLTALNLPQVANSDTSTAPRQLFFKALFAEGSDKSNMFRSKTLIFTSNFVDDSRCPIWESSLFRFEVGLASLTEAEPKLSGDLLLAFYRTRPQGGNDFIGQASFDLGRFAF